MQIIDGTDYVLGELGDEVDPEKKRHILGDAFVKLLDNNLGKHMGNKNAYLVQGTIYPDKAESERGIKSHHNVSSELIKELKKAGRVIEPNSYLFKDEVREVGRQLGIQSNLVERHPFPGPALAVRHVGRVLKPGNYANTCASVLEILGQYNLDGVVVPIGTVGVKGSARDYGNLGIIYGEKQDYDIAKIIANRMANEIPGITRGALILDGERHGQDEWNEIRKMPITKDSLGTLREADNIAMENLIDFGFYSSISQMPVVLLPGPGDMAWVAFRPVITPNFMTASLPEMGKDIGWEYFDKTINDLKRELPVGGIVYDLTPKPPGTIEWE